MKFSKVKENFKKVNYKMEKQMESFKKKARLSRKFSSRKGLGSLKTRFKKFLSDHNGKAGETQESNLASSDSETDERKGASPFPDKSGEIQASLSSGSSSYSDEGSPANTKEEKSDYSSDSSEKRRKMEPSKKSSEKRLQVHLQEDRQEPFGLPPLEETPPSSPQSNPRFSTGGLSDYGRLWAQTSAPNSPANLSHNLNLNYRGGDSSPVALIHSLSRKESGKQASQLSEISFAPLPGSGSFDLDMLGDKMDEFKASPSNTSPSLKPDELPIVHHDEEQGVWRCGRCGWIYPNPNPSLRKRREHKKYCGELTTVQRWLGAEDVHDTPDTVTVKLEGSEVFEGSGGQEKLSAAADEHPMAESEGEDNHEGMSGMSNEPHGTSDQGRLDGIESPDQHGVQAKGIDRRNSNAVVDPDEVDDQMTVHREFDWPTLDTETKESNPEEKLSAADEHPMANSEREDNHGGVSDVSTESRGALDQGRLDEIESPDQHVVQDEGIDRRNSNAIVDPDEVDDQMKVHREFNWPTLDTDAKDQSSPGENLSEKSAHDHEVGDQSKLEEVSNEAIVHPEVEEVNNSDNLVDRSLNIADMTKGVSNATTEVEDEKEEPVAAETHFEEVIDHVKVPQTFGSEVEAHVNQLNQKAQEEEENEVAESQVPPVNSNENFEGSGQHSLTAVHSNGHDLVHFDSSEGLKEEDESARQGYSDHLNDPHENGLTEDPEVSTEQSVLTNDNGIDGGHSVDVSQSLRNANDLSNEKSSDDGLNQEAGTLKEIEKIEPRITADSGKPIDTAQLEESRAAESSLFTANLQSGNEHVENKIGEMVKHEGTGTGSEKMSDNTLLGTEKDEESNGPDFPEHSNQQNVTEIETAEDNSSQISPAQRNDLKIEVKGRLAGSPSPLEEPPKWVNTGSFTSPENGDSFSSVQKYWADVTSSKFLLVEGKRSPSFGRSSDVGFPTFRNGDGMRSPSPFSLSKSEQGETHSIDSANYSNTVVDQDEHRANPSEEERRSRLTLSSSKSDAGEIQSQSSVDSVDGGTTAEDKDEYRAVPSLEKRVSPKPVSLRNSGHDEIQRQSSVDSVENAEEDRAIPNHSAIEHHGSSSSSDHVVYDLEKVVDEQKTHDLICPVCGSDVTKRIILRKRKRTAVPEDDEILSKETMTGQGGADQDQGPQEDDSDDKTWGCLACLSVFIRRDNGETGAVAPPWSIFGEQERSRCLPKLFPRGSGTSDPEFRQPLLGTTETEAATLGEDERVSCYSYLQRFQAHLSARHTNLPEGSGSGLGAASPQVEDEERGSSTCLPDLHAFSWGPIPVYTHPPLDVDGSPSVGTPDAFFLPGPSHNVEQEPSVKGESIEASSSSKSRAEIGDESQTVSYEFRVKERVSLIGTSPPKVDKARAESEEKEKCECLPISAFGYDNVRESEEKEKSACLPFSVFGSERYLPVKTGADAAESPKGRVESDKVSSTSIATGNFQRVETPTIEGSSDFLPASMPAFPWGSSSKYDLPSSPGMLSSHQEITIVTDEAVTSTQLLTKAPQGLENAEEKGSFNCLPELLPAFSWGSVPGYGRLNTDESPATEGHAEPSSAGSAPTSLSKETQCKEGSEEKRSFNCLPELLPAFSWEATGTTTAASAEEAQSREDDKEQGSFKCLPELLPNFSWGTIPVYPPLNIEDITERQPHAPGTTGSTTAAEAEEPQSLEDAKEHGSCNCVPELLPNFSWGAIPVYTHSPLDIEDTTEKERHAPGATVPVHEVPQDDAQALPDLKGKRVVDESYIIPGTSTDQAGDSLRPEEASQNTSVETESKERASCMCIPFEMSEIHWGFTKRTTNGNDLQEPLISRGVDGAIERPAAGPVRLDDSSLTDLKQTPGVSKPLLFRGLGEGLGAPRAGPGPKADSASSVESSPSLTEETKLRETVSEDGHFEGIVTSHEAVTRTELKLAEKKSSFNCLPELIPVSWKLYKEASAHRATAVSEEETQSLEDAEEKRNCSCLSDLLPGFSWEGRKEATSSTTTALAKEPRSLEEAQEQGNFNCLPELPSFSWGAIPVYTDSPLDIEDTTERQRHAPGATGPLHEVPQDDAEALLDLKGKRVLDESYSIADKSTGQAGYGLRPEEASQSTSSHAETDTGERANCMCIPFELSGIHWGFIKRTTNDNDLQEPLIYRGVDGAIEPTVAGRVLLDDSSLIDSKQTPGVSEPLPLRKPEESLPAPRAGPGPKLDTALSAVEYSPFTIDLNEGTRFIETESEELHFEGTVTSHKTVTKTDLDGGLPEVHSHESNYRFNVDINDAHFTSSVEKVQRKPSLTLEEITYGDADSCAHSSSSSASASSESVLQERYRDNGVETPADNLVQHLGRVSNVQQVENNQATTSGTVPTPVQAIVRDLFPADPIQEETEAQETPRQQAQPTFWNESWSCLPLSLPTVRWWGPSRGLGDGLEEHLFDKLNAVRFLRKQQRLVDKAERNQVADKERDDQIEPTPSRDELAVNENAVQFLRKQKRLLDEAQRTQVAAEESDVQSEPTLPRHEPAVDETGEGSHCLPALPQISLYHVFRDHHLSPELPQRGDEVDDVRAPLLGRVPPKRETVVSIEQTTETNITVDSPSSEEAAIEAIIARQGQTRSRGERTSQEYLKSVVHGGLDVTLLSLGVVASAAGGDAKTVTVIAIGLANLVFGIVSHLSNVMSLFYNNHPKFLDEVGQGFVHACLSILSFLFFGALAPMTYGFSFRSANTRNYKMAATCVVALVSIVLLGAANARVKSKSTVRVISLLVVTGFVAAIAGFETGHLASQVLQYFGFSSV